MFTTIDDYDARSRNPFCSVSGLPKLAHETVVFRLADIEFEGCFDIGEQVVRDMAKVIGMVSGSDHQALKARLEEAEIELADAAAELDYLTAELARMTQERNALIAEIYERDNEVLMPEEDDE